MSGRRIPVDLGPLSLHLLEDGRPRAGSSSACVDDVLRLKAVMRASAISPNTRTQYYGFADDDGRTQADTAATSSSSPVAASGECAAITLDEAGVDLLAFEMSAALQSLPLMHARASAEVRLALRPRVLRDTELGVADSGDCLEFSLWVGDVDDGQWLALQLPKLVVALGDRLRRRLRVRVFERLSESRLLAEQVWLPEGDA